MVRGLSLTDVSVFIPVLKESEHLPKLLDRLVEQEISKEIIVAVDEPDSEFLGRWRGSPTSSSSSTRNASERQMP